MWNYRILAKRILNESDVEFGLYEVFYNNDIPTSYTENSMKPLSFEKESDEPTESIKWILEKMKLACDKPILDYDNFPKEYHNLKKERKRKIKKINK